MHILKQQSSSVLPDKAEFNSSNEKLDKLSKDLNEWQKSQISSKSETAEVGIFVFKGDKIGF